LEYWRALERKEVTQEQLKVRRFQQLLQELGREGDPAAMGELYLQRLGQGHCFLPGALETLQLLVKNYRLFLVTNGNPPVQYGRLESAGITRYFEKLFISMEIGHNKPTIEFFDHCFSQIPGFDKKKAIIVGDSLFSDIRGGINAGITTCWVNPNHRPVLEDIVPDYQIENLPQLLPIIQG
jgi:2-haloacid dehalogenase